MNRTARIMSGIALGVVISVGAQAAQKVVKQADLPSAVQKTAGQESAGATVTGYYKDKVDGLTVYEMDLTVDGKTRGIKMDEEGVVTSVVQEMAWDQVPGDVQKNFTNVSSKGKLGPVSSVSKEGKVVAYEAMLASSGVANRVTVRPTAAVEAIPTK
jgi:hypothetical protein